MLSVNVMCTYGEHDILVRCIKSVLEAQVFESIHILLPTNYCKDNLLFDAVENCNTLIVDSNIKIYTHEYEWNNDFSQARNFLLSKTNEKYVLWLDCDDIISKLNIDKWNEIKSLVSFHCPDVLCLTHDCYDNIGVFDCSHKSGKLINKYTMKFDGKIHEEPVSIKMGSKIKTIFVRGISIEHRPIKEPSKSTIRNYEILKQIRNNCQSNESDKYDFFYIRECSLLGYDDECLDLSIDFILNRRGNTVMQYTVACYLSCYYLGQYIKIKENEKFISLAETYARIAMSYCSEMAEPYVYLGRIYIFKGLYKEAIDFLNKALSSNIDINFPAPQKIKMYKEIPSIILAEIYCEIENFENALLYLKYAMETNRDNNLIELNTYALQKIISKNISAKTVSCDFKTLIQQ